MCWFDSSPGHRKKSGGTGRVRPPSALALFLALKFPRFLSSHLFNHFNLPVFFPFITVLFPISTALRIFIFPPQTFKMFSYENLEVYRKAYQANQKVYRLLKENKKIISYAKNQLGRASLSIMLNIAEGSAKFSDKDRKNFYITARGSVFECHPWSAF